jgi:hypothetical protein
MRHGGANYGDEVQTPNKQKKKKEKEKKKKDRNV